MNELIQATMNYVSAHPYLVSAGVLFAGSSAYGLTRYLRHRTDARKRRGTAGDGTTAGSIAADALDAFTHLPGKGSSSAGSAFHGAGGLFSGAGASGAYDTPPDLPDVDGEAAGSLLETIGEGAAKVGEGLVEIISNIDP